MIMKGLARASAASAAKGKLRGIGFSAYIEACGIAPSAAVGSLGAGVGLWESAEVRVNPVGTVEVLTGSHSHGQGHETTFAQLVSDRLGIPIENVSIVHGDTDKVQMGMGTYGSRSGAVGMSAIFKALDKVDRQGQEGRGLCAGGCRAGYRVQGRQIFGQRAPTRPLDFGDGRLAGLHRAQIQRAGAGAGAEGRRVLRSDQLHLPVRRAYLRGRDRSGYGRAEIARWTAVDDFGNIINPMIVEGQVHGGIAQGIGQALLEGAVYDKNGQLVTASYMDYTMPRADDLPSFGVGMTSTPCASQPARHQGLRRGRRDCRTACGDQRDHRRARP